MYTHSLRSTVLLALFAGAVALPTRLVAQEFGDTIVAPASTWTTPAPVTEGTTTAVVAPSGARLAPVAVTAKSMSYAPVDNTAQMSGTGEHVGQSRAMMGVGAVALVVGLIVGGDVGTLLAVGGAAFALVGLYRYMQ